jgi:hypothetical protein
MWLITTHGFLSVVQNLNFTGPDDALLGVFFVPLNLMKTSIAMLMS